MALNTVTIAEEIRFLLGGLSVATMSDELLTKIIQRNIDKYGDDDANLCIVTYRSLLDVLQYLINQSAQGSGSIAGGAVIERTEYVGKKRITEKYSSEQSGSLSGWEDLYDKFLKNPALVCESLIPDPSDTSGMVIIGGVNMDSYIANLDDPTTRNGFDINVSQVIDRRPTARERRRACVKFY